VQVDDAGGEHRRLHGGGAGERGLIDADRETEHTASPRQSPTQPTSSCGWLDTLGEFYQGECVRWLAAGGACGAGLCCEAVYLLLGGGFEGDPVAYGGELGDVVAQPSFSRDVGGVVVEVAKAAGRVGQQVCGDNASTRPSGITTPTPPAPERQMRRIRNCTAPPTSASSMVVSS
jgi:hypothetical protein